LVVTMCHEFNNPLAAIKISADILIRQDLPDEEKKLLTELNRNIALLENQIVKLRDLNTGRPPSLQQSNEQGKS
jgi:signal transduction histidine kinase